jgi:hypothetical protein
VGHSAVTFGDVSNYNTETLAFEVVNFSGPYHIILGRPCYVKFMANPSYTYLNLRIHGPIGIIIVEAKTQRALDCEKNNIELAVAAVAMVKVREVCLSIPPPLTGPAMPASSSAFKEAEDAKSVQINTEDLAKTVQIGAGLNPK